MMSRWDMHSDGMLLVYCISHNLQKAQFHQCEMLAKWSLAKQLVSETTGYRAKLRLFEVFFISMPLEITQKIAQEKNFPVHQNTA